MKTKEFIEKVEELGYCVRKYKNRIDFGDMCYIKDRNDCIIAIINKSNILEFDTSFQSWHYVVDEDKSKLLDLIVEYAKTPIEDREEEKKYYLKHKWLKIVQDGLKAFLNYCEDKDKFYLFTKGQTDYVKTKFTLNEIEEIKEKFDTDLSDFELVEVNNEN